MSDEAAIATLETKIESLTASISALTQSVEKNNEKLERLAVLEVAHNNTDKALDRAFSAIKAAETALSDHIEKNAIQHEGYSKWIWVAVGFCSAISVMWTVVGYRMNAMIDDQVRAVAEMRMHIHDDKIKDPADVVRAMGGQK